MQEEVAAPAAAAAAPRRREYTVVDPRSEWARAADADTLVVDVSGFRKEELKVLYNTSRKLKVTGERQVDGARWARFLKAFPVPRSCDSRAIRAVMDKEEALLYVILPKGSSSSSSSLSIDEEKEQRRPESSEPHGEQIGGEQRRPESSEPHGEQIGGAGSADGRSAQEDLETSIGERKKEADEMQKKEQEVVLATQEDEARTDGDDANAVREVDGDDANAVREGDGEGNKNRRWWKKIRPLHVLGFVLLLALVGVGACLLYVMLQ